MAVATETNNPPDQVYSGDDVPPQDDANPKQFINWWQDRLTTWTKYHSKQFEMMVEDQRFRRGIQWDGQKTLADDRYVVNEVQSEVAASVSVLYAKNPTFTVKRKERMDFKIWDEVPATYEEARTMVEQATMSMQPPPPDALALLMDVEEGKQRRAMIDRVAKTLQILFAQQLQQQFPDFKQEMKQLIDRVECQGAGYLKLGYLRLGEITPDAAGKLADMDSRLSHLQALASAEENGQGSEYSKEAEEIRIAMKTLQEQSYVITREGLDIKFPRTTSLIIDPACSQLRGFVGARAVAEEYYMTACDIFATYKKKVGSKASAYSRNRVSEKDDWSYSKKTEKTGTDYDDYYRVLEVYHKATGSTFTICEGFDEYLAEPAAPDILLEQFYPYYPLHFNRCEDDISIIPPSTVRQIRHQQQELNRQKQALREHRKNSKPQYAGTEGVLSEQDKTAMETAPAFAMIELQGLQPGQKVDDVFQQIKKHGIDPNMYDSNGTRDDMRRVTRRTDASLGGTSRATATADSIGEQSRQTEDQSKADDLDDMLSLVARDAGSILMMNMPREKVIELVGPGAAWPQANPAEVLQDIMLDVEAGSSGRRNKVMEVANLQRLVPLLIQLPGIRPDWLARQAVKLADSTIDFTEAYLEGQPSIQAMNAMLQKAAAAQQMPTGDPQTDPQAQGAQGSNPAPKPPGQDMSLGINPGMNDVPMTM